MISKRKMRDRVTFTRRSTSQDAFGNNSSASDSDLGTFWANVHHDSGNIVQEFQGQNQIKTEYTLYFRKKSVQSILKGDIATLETPNVQVKIDSIVEFNLSTIKMTGTSVS